MSTKTLIRLFDINNIAGTEFILYFPAAAQNQISPEFITSGYCDDVVMTNPQQYGFVAALQKHYRLNEFLDLIGKINGPD